MQIVFDLDHIPLLSSPAVLTMGNFDGLHLGHLHLLQQLKTLGPTAPKVLITFSNHPAEVLKKQTPFSTLTTLEHKVSLFEKAGIDLLILLEFTPELAEQPYDLFIKNLLTRLPFSHLVLGENAQFGKNREGTMENVTLLGKELGFTPVYVPKFSLDNTIVSSGKIRELIAENNLSLASQFLGRPFSIYAPFRYDNNLLIPDKMTLQSHALPPSGSYDVSIIDGSTVSYGKLDIDKESKSMVLKPAASAPFQNLFLEVIFSFNPLAQHN